MPGEIQGLSPVSRGQHRVPVVGQELAGQLSNPLFIFDEENRLATEKWRRGGDDALITLGNLDRPDHLRQKNLEGGASSGLTVHPNPATALFDNSVDRGQAQPGALAGLFGGEKWLKDVRLRR